MVKARLDGMGLFDFHRADELIALGRDAARRAIPEIVDHLAATPAVIQPAR
jgi:NTE family protein